MYVYMYNIYIIYIIIHIHIYIAYDFYLIYTEINNAFLLKGLSE